MAAPQQMIERLHRLRRKDAVDRRADEGRLAAGVEHLRQRAVRQHDAASRIQRGHAVGDGLEHGLQLAAASLQRRVGGGELQVGGLRRAAAVLPDRRPCG